ncbi:MAG: hypothetical protein ACRDJ1_10580 [Actinomycetota bacterium]
MNEDRSRSVWNVVALIAGLGLAAVVAVVAVSRSDRPGAEAEGTPSASASPSPSPTAPGTLAGQGPYLVYATGSEEIIAYDTAAKQWISMGNVDGPPVTQHARQPGSGLVAAFATDDGTVWRVDREGLERVALLPVSDPRLLDGGTVSRDGQRFAIAMTGPDPELMIVNLGNGRTAALPRRSSGGNRYPDDAALVPIGWSLGGSLVYQLPVCNCADGAPGLYLYDLATERSTIVQTTAQGSLDRSAISPDGQEVIWGDGQTLRRVGAGRQSAAALRRASGGRIFSSVLWSTDGTSLLLAIGPSDPGGEPTIRELVDPESGDRERTVPGIPEEGLPLALLPGRRVVVHIDGGSDPRLSIFVDGTEAVLSKGEGLVFLGWLR